MHLAPEYVQARTVLFDALAALGPHRANVVLVGAQAVYHHTGESDLAVAPMTTDGDLALDTRRLADNPEIGKSLRDAGFTAGAQPGRWIGRRGVAVDIMVVPSQANTTKRGARAARLPPHEGATARITRGLEPALFDNERVRIAALADDDARVYDIRIAGPAALLVSKAIKIGERLARVDQRPDRLKEKDALDAFRLLQTVETDAFVDGFQRHTADSAAAGVSATGLELIRREGLSPEATLPRLAAAAALGDPTVAASFVVLAEQLIMAVAPTR